MARHALLLIALFLGACAQRPAHMVDPPAGRLSVPLQGSYIATATAPFIGPVSARLTAVPIPKGGFVCYSRPDVAWSMIGGLQGFFGPIFLPNLFPNGVILNWVSAAPDGAKPGMGSIGIAGLRSAQVTTRMTAPDAPVEILAPDDQPVAYLSIRPASSSEPPLADYPALAANVASVIRSRLYDPSLVNSFQVAGYLSQLTRNARLAQDDIEFIFGAAVAARNNVKFSLPLVIRRANDETRRAFPGPDPRLSTVRASYDRRSGIATLRADAFIDAADVDRAFRKILADRPRGLIVDLNSCPGVTLASLRVASWLFPDPVDAGFFFAPSRRKDALAGRADAFPRAEIDSAESVARAESLLDTSDGIAVVIRPEAETFTGPVVVLTSKRTTTSAEPLVAMLKSTGRAQIIGQTTAGKPMLSRPIDIGQGWDLWLASADFRPVTGEPLNGRGVRPDDELSSRESGRRAARRWIMEHQPAPAPMPTAPSEDAATASRSPDAP